MVACRFRGDLVDAHCSSGKKLIVSFRASNGTLSAHLLGSM